MASQQQVWLVTGCSTGFGREIVPQILDRGDKVIATARNIDSIKDLEGLGAGILQLDVTASFEDIQQKIDEAITIYGRIDVLFANAGYVHYAPIEEADASSDILRNMSTNTFGATNLLRALMPQWRKQKSGFLLVNSSYMSWWSTHPGCGPYAASKAALDRLVTTFAKEAELQQLNIKTLVVHPGHFRTDATKLSKYNFDRPTTSYAEINAFSRGTLAAMHGQQPGDVKKACKVLIDLIKGEGDVEGKEISPTLPLGTDAWETCVQETEKYLEMLKDWEGVIRSTDIVSGSSEWGAQVTE
ncbi:hypothetical protein M409DRAFT_71614 [Zasmidium cellare ATCC 36951]|uniref:Uncharacterized protein n=1 Tax=Zasmidium cellare ATCC 36951 TaxID=1080233 RepID=A0A6A6BUM2_ZASCE|nr:uncharacterized protein M409DRAFT_71614 [Zasmidium cellare ATCC 36951]KAF2158494.1 hypothetical protein M409DRAFT_71614 [Zasmidium cellare ATCC 36951]